MKILLVEDQKMASEYIARGLKEQGMVVDIAANGPDGLHYLLTNEYDLAILDVMLPGLSGWDILEMARKAGKQTTVMYLTARDNVEDRVRGLELGADDYLIKPFSFSELLARIRVIQRRQIDPHQPESTVLRVADLELDLLKHQAYRQGKRLELTPREFTLLSLLMRRSGEVLSRIVISEMVWDMNFDSGTNVVDVAIRRLRTKVDDPYSVKLLHTIRGAGYVMELRDETV
ncbi:heavy metal response regulator transcription factor [Budviciaceae bacterium BWR-B9]|uniref:Heavy metal response regulator transcription factor n=1 Tax=Limnobaculum allomyrinae TaxID=2791986 RepID=A0ABS1IQX0_9GAMM|nr:MULTISPECIES: heavy metal response regulator transcription factor [Limnobaculum]MBK5144092.1 heavy metal response regulator transcription factor [Limnobaculum allomyrinae]MBV7691751.1 heavy metal response regulator transcription factor [Limnobaculum sp. M2-1]